MARFSFFLGADADFPIRKTISILNSSRCIGDYPEIEGSFAHLDLSADDCAEAVCESGERVYSLIAESEIMDSDEAHEALCYALFEGGSLNPDLRIISIE